MIIISGWIHALCSTVGCKNVNHSTETTHNSKLHNWRVQMQHKDFVLLIVFFWLELTSTVKPALATTCI
jgi:hypothetical protein